MIRGEQRFGSGKTLGRLEPMNAGLRRMQQRVIARRCRRVNRYPYLIDQSAPE
jgi:hypothetical protein